jgi:VIT1/CCC1 family predicted Fe2+/Mn2+ transporter
LARRGERRSGRRLAPAAAGDIERAAGRELVEQGAMVDEPRARHPAADLDLAVLLVSEPTIVAGGRHAVSDGWRRARRSMWSMLSKGPISPTLHGTLDYVLGVVLVLAPFVLGFDSDTATTVSVVAGIAELIVAMTTDWSRGIVKLIPPAVHGMIDAVFVLALILVPFVFGFSGDDDTATAFFVILGVGGVLLVLATRFVPDAGTRRGGVPPRGSAR